MGKENPSFFYRRRFSVLNLVTRTCLVQISVCLLRSLAILVKFRDPPALAIEGTTTIEQWDCYQCILLETLYLMLTN